MKDADLSHNEKSALLLVARGCLLVTSVPDTNERNVFGDTNPGRGVYRKLIKKGLVFETTEDVMEDGFQFTSSYELTDEGEEVVRTLR